MYPKPLRRYICRYSVGGSSARNARGEPKTLLFTLEFWWETMSRLVLLHSSSRKLNQLCSSRISFSFFCQRAFFVVQPFLYYPTTSSLREIYTLLPSLILHASSSVQNSREQEALVLFFSLEKKCEKRDVFIQWPIRHDGAITSFSPHHNERCMIPLLFHSSFFPTKSPSRFDSLREGLQVSLQGLRVLLMVDMCSLAAPL